MVAAFERPMPAMQTFLTLLLLDDRWRRRRYWLAIALFIAILVVGSIPGARQEIGLLARGVILHSVAYSLLTLLLFTGSTGSRTYRAVSAVLTAMAMGAADELLQSALPYRVGALSDWLVDSTASVVTASLLWAFLPRPVTAAGTVPD